MNNHPTSQMRHKATSQSIASIDSIFAADNASSYDEIQITEQLEQLELIPYQQLKKVTRWNRLLKRLQLCQITVAFLNFMLIVTFAILFQTVDHLKFPFLHVSIAIYQALAIGFYFVSFCLFRANEQFIEDYQAGKTCKQQLKMSVYISISISLAGAFLLVKMISYGIKINFQDDSSGTTDYDFVIMLIDVLFTVAGMQILAIFITFLWIIVVIFNTLLACIHLIVYIVSKWRISLLKKFYSYIYRKLAPKKRIKQQKKILKILDFKLAQDKANFEQHTCSICQETFQDMQKIYTLPCMSQSLRHSFHSECLQKWATKSDRCPICRTSFGGHLIHI